MISHGYCFLGSSFLDAFSITLKEFSRLHYCSIIKVLCCCSRDSFVILAHSVGFCQQLFLFFLKLFSTSAAPPESYNGLWFLVVSFVVSCRFRRLCYLTRAFFFWQVFFYFSFVFLFVHSFLLFSVKNAIKKGLKYLQKILKTFLYILQ